MTPKLSRTQLRATGQQTAAERAGRNAIETHETGADR